MRCGRVGVGTATVAETYSPGLLAAAAKETRQKYRQDMRDIMLSCLPVGLEGKGREAMALFIHS